MELWHYDPPPDLAQPLVERLRRFPREPDMLVFGVRGLSAVVLRGWLKLYHRFTVVGRENLPSEGSYVMVANHCSHLDTLCLQAALPLRKLHRAFPAAAKDYFFVSTPRVLLAAIVTNALPFDRKLDPRQGLELCGHLLDNPGNVLIVFPEGTRSETGELRPFKPGLGLLLAGRDVPVVPCLLEGTFAALPKGTSIPRPRSICLRIGTPRRYGDRRAGKRSAMEICSDLHDAVAALSADAAKSALPIPRPRRGSDELQRVGSSVL
jgi:1-acyl-sn-glycerol-3-phosphate acyltransferase